MLTVRVYLTVFLIVTSTGRVMGRVIGYVTQYVPYHTLCKSQYMLTPLSRAWVCLIHIYLLIHLTKHCTCPAQAVFRYECIVKCYHLKCPYPKVIMCRPLHRGYAGATGGMHVICIWGFTLREENSGLIKVEYIGEI